MQGILELRLLGAGRSVPEIASITEHALKEAEAIFDSDYLSRDSGLADLAISKLEKHASRPTFANQTANRALQVAKGSDET